MTMFKWVAALLSGFGLSASRRRSSVWSGGSSGVLEIQALESRQVMSAANATSVLNALTTDGEVNSSPASSAAGAVTFASGATAMPRVAVPTTEDLFDEGAGAVWGGLTENLSGGANWLLMPPRGNPGTTGPGLGDFPPAGWGGSWGGGTTTGGITGGGGGVTGGGSGNGSLAKVEILAIDNEALEGPYEISRRDEAIFRLRRIGGDLLRSLPVRVELWGDATPGRDYRITDMNRDLIDPDPFGSKVPSVTITIPYGKDIVDFKMLTCMDGEFEADESVLPTVVRVAGGQYEPGVVPAARATIYDKTADIDIASAENREKLLSDTAEDNPGATIFVDSDFDAGKPQHDKEFYNRNVGGFAEAEDDVLNMTVTSHVLPDNDSAAKGLPRSFTFTFDILRVRLFEPDISKGIKNLIWRPITSETTFKIKQGETLNFRVEGLSAGKGSIGLVWKDTTGIQRDIVFDSVKYTSWDVDIDIDSNNNNGLGDPEYSDWEEYIEDSKYGIGKILYPSKPDQTIDHDPQRFTPVKFLRQNVDPNVGVKFVWNELQGDSGYVRIWTAPSNVNGGLKMTPVEDGGHLITQGRVYTGEELAKISGLWMQAVVAQTAHNTMAGIEIKRPNDRLKMELLRRDNPSTAWITLRSDEVKYLVCDNADRFYPNLQFDHRERYWNSQSESSGIVLRDSLLSEGVYSLADMPEYGQQRLSEKQMLDMGIFPNTVKLIMEAQQGDGLKCVLYRDYLSEDGNAIVLSFAGTEMEFQDVLSDILQGIGLEGTEFMETMGVENQYGIAMEIGYWLSVAAQKNGLSLRTTGHSLGGGLASAASIVANECKVPANTFNAAGLHRNTLTRRNAAGYLIRGASIYPGALEQLYRERVGLGVITAYSMEYDPLTLFQRNMPPIEFIGSVPISAGRQVTLAGPQTAVFTQGVIRLKAALQKMPSPSDYSLYSRWWSDFKEWTFLVVKNNWDTLRTMMHHHKIRTCQYGLMVEQNAVPARSRKFDIFGYKDPDQ